jgi:hypothetical protein
MLSHLSRSAAAAVRVWVDELREQGEKPGLVLLHKVAADESPDVVEKQFIRLLSSTGKLINFRPGKQSGVLPAAAELRNWLHGHGVSQDEFARLLGTDQSVVSRWVNGTRVPCTRNVMAISRITDISPELWASEAA